MTIPLKYATAGQEIPLGYFLDSSDGDTEETPTIANTDIKLWKSGATSLANKNSGGATQMSGGLYYCVLDATDTNTYGPLVVYLHKSGSLVLKQECWVMNPDAYDALFAANGTGSIESSLVAVAAAVANKIADHIWRRTFQNACDSSDGDTKTGRSGLGLMAKAVNKVAPNGSNLETFEDDDTTVLLTQAVTTNPAADPITALDTT